MAHSLVPTRLSLQRRFGLLLARWIMAFFLLIEKLRPSPRSPSSVALSRYGPDEAETVQRIARSAGSPERAPVVFIHGGGWIIGKKELYTRELFFLADAGYPVFNVEYPTAPENPHPGILLSLLNALRWIRREEPGVDAVHLMGDSAGGNLAMMLGILSANPRLLVDLEFELHPPCFLVAGSKDRLAESTRILGRRLESGPGIARSKIYEGEMHGFFNMSWRPASSELKRDVLAFLEAHDPVCASSNEPRSP